MGKKTQKAEKGAPEDVFDPLLVESKQAATVVLMLNSQEDEILAKACESIYKFIDKCDENKKTLLDLEVIEPLLKLLHHEERPVRRNACMCLGVMSTYADARKILRKNESTIPQMIHLLSPEEETVVHEFAGLCLSSMAVDFSSKVAIFEQEGLEPLIRLLSATDPDVQKNAVETVSLMMQDYQTKADFRRHNGFEPLLELVQADYPIIQHLALQTLIKATEDVENRAAMREADGINRMISFIGNPKWNDLHVFAVMVISNCLEDPENMQQIKETGGLIKLLAYITDATPPEDDEASKPKGAKGGKADKGGGPAGKGGKKGKDDEIIIGSLPPEKGRSATPERSPIDPIIPTLPEVKEHAALALSRAAKLETNRKTLHEQEGEKVFVQLLTNENVNVQVAATKAVAIMAETTLIRDTFGQLDAVDPLIKLLKCDNVDAREAASVALAQLTTAHMANCHEVVRHHGLDPLISLLGDSRAMSVAHAAVVLTHLASDESYRAMMLAGGAVPALVPTLSSPSILVQSKVTLAIGALFIDQAARDEFRELKGIEALVNLLNTKDDTVRRNVSWAVTVCAVDGSIANEITTLGGLDVLQEIQQSAARKNAFTDLAVKKILNSNLTAKYALSGNLGIDDRIEDGFMDLGQLRPGTKILTLEEYYKEPINQRRPILFINAKPEKPDTPAPTTATQEQETVEKSGKTSGAGGRSSRTGKDKHKKKEKEKAAAAAQQQQKDTADISQQEEPGPFSPPGDNNFMHFLEEMNSKITPLPTIRDQVVALAQSVADKLGGPIDKGQLSNFSWELHISQLKFDRRTNVLPIGVIKTGIHYHRALLFKVIADRIGIMCTLVRGQYNRAWNEVFVSEEDQPAYGVRLPPSKFIIDLIHYPGRLMPPESVEAASYQRI